MSQSYFIIRFLFIVSYFNLTANKSISQGRKQYFCTKVNIQGSNIRAILQDSKDFLWIGNQDALYRFDSKNILPYTSGSEAKRNIQGADVRCLFEDTESIWVATFQNGLCRIDKLSGNIVLVLDQSRMLGLGKRSINAITGDSSFVFAATENGVYVYNKKNDNWILLPLPEPFSRMNSEKILLCKNGVIIFFRNFGIVHFDFEKRKIVGLHSAEHTREGYDFRYYDHAQLTDSSWLIATSKGIQLLRIEKKIGLFVDPEYFRSNIEAINRNIYAIALDKDGHCWFSNDNYLVRVAGKSQTYDVVESTLGNTSDWAGNVYRIYCDRNGDMWLGCQTGLYYLKNTPPAVVSYQNSKNGAIKLRNVYYVMPSKDSIIYATSENGLYRIDMKGNEINVMDGGQPYDYIFLDPFGTTITSNGLGLGAIKRGTNITISTIYPEFRRYEKAKVNSHVVLNDSTLVLGTESRSGILVWDFKNHIVNCYNANSGSVNLCDNVVNNIYRLSSHEVIVLGDICLSVFDMASKRAYIINIESESKGVTPGLFFDLCRLSGCFYVACYGYGIFKLDSNFNYLERYTVENGLSNNSVYKVVPWRDSLLFISTNSGVNILNIHTNRISYLFKNDGLQDNVFEETSGILHNNIVFFGGRSGVSVIRPERMHGNATAPTLYFSAVDIEFADRKRLDTCNLNLVDLSISPKAIQTTIHLSGINYSNPERTTFKYKIKEISDEWIDLGTKTSIPLIGIGPGTYHLSVQAFNEDGVGSEVKTLTLRFLPKWYQTLGFKIGVGLLLFGMVYALYRYRIAQIRKQHQIRKDIASDLHDDIGSTLNSVKVFTHLAIEGKNKEAYLEQAKENLSQASASLRDMIWVLDDKLDTIEQLSSRLRQFVMPLANAMGLEVVFNCTPEAQEYRLHKNEKRNLLLICKESINNSIKYAGASLLQVTITMHNKKPHIHIQDNGKGFDMNNYQAGNGIKNLQYRGKQIGYTVDVQSAPGKGTEITVSA